ncbi:MAG TPA: protein kinase [Ktedonobacteraceae bacterium]
MSTSGSQGPRKNGQHEALIGRTLQSGEYIVEAILGHGGMGQVYLASHAQVDVPVAIKQVRADEPLPPGVIEELDQLLHSKNASVSIRPALGEFPLSGGVNTDRFLREALLLARMRHPAIPLLYDYFLENGHWYLVMEYVPGSTLSAYMREHAPLPPLEAVNYALQICDVLDYLHRQNPPVVFRDLKPANIILHPDGRLMIVDFGIARYFKEGQFNDTTDFGSPGYASPEQYEGTGQTDARSDLFSLGVIIHEMLSGQRPTRRGVEMEQLEVLNKLNPAISPALSGLVMVATRTEPMYRFQSAHTFYQALERVRSVEERRAYRYHTLMAEVTASQKTPVFPMLIPPPSSQGFLSSELAREQDQRAQHMRMREQAQRTLPRAGLEQEALAHQLTSIDESLKLRAISSPLTTRGGLYQAVSPSGSYPAMVPSDSHSAVRPGDLHSAVRLSHSQPVVRTRGSLPPGNMIVDSTQQPVVALAAAPDMLPARQEPVAPPPPARRKRGKAWLVLSLILLILLLSVSWVAYRYLASRTSVPIPARLTLLKHSQFTSIPTRPVDLPQSWQSLSALPSTQADNTALYVQDQDQGFIYMTGGFRGAQAVPEYSHGLYRYNISTAHWSKLDLPGFPAMVNNAAAQDQQGDLFFTGGYQPDTDQVSSNLYLYQPATGTLRVLYLPAQLPLGFGGSMLADQQGHLYLTEGFLTAGSPYALAGTGWYRYDIASGLWHNLTTLPVGLGYVQLAQDASGDILLIGGSRDAGLHQPSTHIYRFNPQQNAWSLDSNAIPGPISGASSCPDGQGNLVVIGGYNPTLNRAFNTAWLFNLQNLQWRALPPLPSGGSVLGTASCDGRGHVYLTRGASNPAKPTADFFELTLPKA